MRQDALDDDELVEAEHAYHARQEDLGHSAGGEALQHLVLADGLPDDYVIACRQRKRLDHISMFRFPSEKINEGRFSCDPLRNLVPGLIARIGTEAGVVGEVLSRASF